MATIVIPTSIRAKIKLPSCILEVVQGPEAGKRRSFQSRQIRIGREAEDGCDFVIADESVSGLHCELLYDEELGYRLRDHDSTNGVWIGGLRIAEVYLTSPTDLRVGDSLVRFHPDEKVYELQGENKEVQGDQIFASPSMQKLHLELTKLAEFEGLSILFLGETGTGKSLLAEELHKASPRRQQPLIQVNCAAIPEHLLESELFGYKKGAFTGADRHHEGALKRADGGTLLLDEIGDLPWVQQAKLLTALETKTFYPLGASQPETSDFRLLSATCRDLPEEVANGNFREDLYYRIAVFEMTIPPLRERPKDIEQLLELFLREVLEENADKGRVEFSKEAKQAMGSFAWPGNVRQLRNAVLSAATRALARRQPEISIGDLPPQLRNARHTPTPTLANDGELGPYHQEKKKLLDAFQRSYMERLLAKTQGNVSEASRIAEIDRKHVTNLKKRFGL